ncbi:MAG: DNA repair protein RecN (Recombination protein N) [Rhodospirillaceae bacterium]|nr:MAG: DNA repair protein RecN (Recombination protein N) [Rhodospirillaceae bacterium]
MEAAEPPGCGHHTAELGPLKLEQALFRTQVVPMPETEWSANGLDQVTFTVATNPAAPGPPPPPFTGLPPVASWRASCWP